MHTFSYMRNARMGIDEDERPTRQTVRRVMTFARPYRRQLIAFVAVIVIESVLALIPTLGLRALIGGAIPATHTRQLAVVAAAATSEKIALGKPLLTDAARAMSRPKVELWVGTIALVAR